MLIVVLVPLRAEISRDSPNVVVILDGLLMVKSFNSLKFYIKHSSLTVGLFVHAVCEPDPILVYEHLFTCGLFSSVSF